MSQVLISAIYCYSMLNDSVWFDKKEWQTCLDHLKVHSLCDSFYSNRIWMCLVLYFCQAVWFWIHDTQQSSWTERNFLVSYPTFPVNVFEIRVFVSMIKDKHRLNPRPKMAEFNCTIVNPGHLKMLSIFIHFFPVILLRIKQTPGKKIEWWCLRNLRLGPKMNHR